MKTNRPLFVKRFTPFAEFVRTFHPVTRAGVSAPEAAMPPGFVLESRATMRRSCRESMAQLLARLARRGEGTGARRSYRMRLGRTLFQRRWARAVDVVEARAAAEAEVQ